MSAAEAVCETRINGFSILFPEGKKPFAPQLAVISKVLKALKDKENALLESPTGTGKVILYDNWTSFMKLSLFLLRLWLFSPAPYHGRKLLLKTLVVFIQMRPVVFLKMVPLLRMSRS